MEKLRMTQFSKHKTKSAKSIFEELKKKNIYVRYWDKPEISDYLRITIGRDSDMRTFYAALEEILNKI